MNPVIVIESEFNGPSGPPREVLCSVWPVSQNDGVLAIGEPIFANHMVLVGVPPSKAFGSVLKLPKAGVYLVDVGYPNGQSLRTTISADNNKSYRLVVDTHNQTFAIPDKKKNTLRRVPRVVSASRRSHSTKKMELEVSVISQSNLVSLSGLYEFVTGLEHSTNDWENIFEHSANAELIHELSLPTNPQEQWSILESTIERKWLIVSCKGKPQNLVAYPHGWRCENRYPFKLVINRKNKDGRDIYKWPSSKWSTSLKLMDPVYGSLIEYLTRRDIFSTRSISESERGKATTALYKKIGNPFSAAAAAYVFSLTGSEDPRHHSWMRTLSLKYSWLPDSAIALGWKTLREGQANSVAWEEARKLICLACSRGLPYYTVGLHILVDALTLLKRINPEDSEILEMLAAAKAADVACVRTEPFTTLQISRYLGLPMRRE
ncbi:hypothetical protein [Aeromonas caviae]|uniref:hypothetical protein n=1 Tax=Aeromonas caviae TaxID=648 RepID=UPI002B248669|nr:hypothetical protein [Aeromonas caviae]MEA9429362.1 hypothetical protein [Aeromonas caviae]MEA9433990.1 hypothetical protein [Aeromonas caviae]